MRLTVLRGLGTMLPWAHDLEVNVVFDHTARVVNIEMLDVYLQNLRPLSREEAERRLSTAE
jgi:predicted TIM-barrel fold metal-dependent hydrolase